MNVAALKNHGALLHPFPAFHPRVFTAGGALAGVLQNGSVIDRQDLTELARSAQLALVARGFSLGPATATVAVAIADSADGVTFAAFGTQPDNVVLSSDDEICWKYDLNLTGARRFLRFNITVTFSAANTDTLDLAAILTMAGFQQVPVTESNEPGSSS